MMKVGYLLQNAFLDLSASKGTQVHIRGVLLGLESAGIDVDVIAIDDERAFRIKGSDEIGTGRELSKIQVDLGLKGDQIFRFLKATSWKIQKSLGLPYMTLWDNLILYEAILRSCSNADILHGHFDLVPLGITKASRQLDTPLVIDCEADHFDEWRLRKKEVSPLLIHWARFWQQKCFDVAKAVICVSVELCDYLANEWHLPEEKLHVVPNGVDTEFFRPLPRSSGEMWRKELGLNDEPTIIFVGIFSERHALQVLIDSFSLVLQKIPDCRLILVGDGDIRPALEAKILEGGLASSVRITGRVDIEQIPKLLSIADVAVSPSVDIEQGSNIKTSPLKVLEYMAAGKAAVVTAAGQSKELIEDGKTGLLVPADDAKAFAHAIICLIQNAEERRAIGDNARQVAVKNHSWSHYGEKIKAIYSHIV